MGNHKRRLERLEGGRKGPSAAILIVPRGETTDEAWQKHLAQHPENEHAEIVLVIKGRDPDPSITPPPLRSEPQESPKAPGPAAVSLIR